MGGFSIPWLQLREPVDRRSRCTAVAAGLQAAFAQVDCPVVVDLGCGLGANLRATAPLLGRNQDWILLDNDSALLSGAAEILAVWADDAVRLQDGLRLSKDGKTLRVRFLQCDLEKDLDVSLPERTDLVTASAFFDLVSPAFIDRLAAAVVRRTAAFHTVLTYDGVQAWSPPCASDADMVEAFNAHQRSDKGFGAAAGPTATALLQQAFATAGYRTHVGDSPWRLDREDGELIGQLADGIVTAVAETGRVDAATIADWRTTRRDTAWVGHLDLLALPPG